MTGRDTDKTDEYYVAIVNIETEDPYKVMGPMSERMADKCARGAGINNNWGKWAIDVIHEDDIDEMWKSQAK